MTSARNVLTPVRKLALLIAALLATAAGVLSILGMRSDVAFLSGGPTSEWSAACGIAYVLTWFGAIVVAPPLALFVVVDIAVERLPFLVRWIASSRP